jgi:DNA-binding response OmpR family regulator
MVNTSTDTPVRNIGRAINPSYVTFLEARVKTLEAMVSVGKDDLVLPPGVRLTEMQNRLLTIFVARPGKTVTRDQLFTLLYGDRVETPKLKTVDVLLSKLRGRLGEYPMIETVYSQGYRMTDTYTQRFLGKKSW